MPLPFRKTEAEGSSYVNTLLKLPLIFRKALEIWSKAGGWFFAFALAYVDFVLLLQSNFVLFSSVLSWMLVFHTTY